MVRTHRRACVLALLVALAAAAGACSSGTSSTAPVGVPDGLPAVPANVPATKAFSTPGPYAAGVSIITTAAGDPVVLTYPVDPSSTAGKPTYTVDLLRWYLGAPNEPIPASFAALHLPTTLATTAYADLPAAAGGPFPVILFSHGFGGYPEQSSFLTIHLATWGFVVVAPDHRSRDLAAVLKNTSRQCACDVTDLRAALQDVTAMDHAAGTLLSGKLDLTRVASLGHSAGGGAAISIAAQPGVKGFVAMAPVPGRIPPAGKPGLIMQGTGDQVVLPTDGVHVYRTLNTPKRLILIDSGGHNVFSDACVIGAAQGGLRAFIGNLNLPASFQRLALDGCSPPDVFPPTAWPLIDHAVTAQIRWALGIDPEPVGLGSDLNNAYTGVTAHVTSNP